jgi:hypothetical protein
MKCRLQILKQPHPPGYLFCRRSIIKVGNPPEQRQWHLQQWLESQALEARGLDTNEGQIAAAAWRAAQQSLMPQLVTGRMALASLQCSGLTRVSSEH